MIQFLLGGIASVGKTNFALNIINNIAIKDKKSVLFFSLECSKEKIISIAGMIPASSIVGEERNLKDSEFLKLNEIIKEIEKAQIYIDDTPRISINEICEKTSNISYRKVAHRENHIPKIEDLTPNIDYERYADIIILLHREECFNKLTQKKNVADVIIAKKKNDMKTSIELAWNQKYLKFLNL